MKRLLVFLGLLFGSLPAWSQTYCTSNLYNTGCLSGDVFDGFKLSNYSDTNTGCGLSGYSDYTATSNIQLTHQNSYTLTARTSYQWGGEYFGVYIDFNDDGDFLDAGEFIMSSTYSASSTTPYVDSLYADPAWTVGTHRMRVRMNYGTFPPLDSAGACATATWGETHDYTVDIIANIVGGCATPFTNWVVDSILDTSAKIDWTPGAGNTSFYLEYDTAGFTPGNGTKITGTYPSPTGPPVKITGLSADTKYDVYFGEICNSGADTVYFGGPQKFTTTVSCPAPYGVQEIGTTATTATVAWNSYTGTDFKLEWGPTGFAQGTGTSGRISDTIYTMTGLTPLTEYDVYVFDSCGLGNYSTVVGPFSVTTGCAGPLSGTYTLNPNLPYSSTNFVSFNQLALAFNLCGITGPVTINVSYPSVFHEQVEFGEITGASATNTVTINGNGATLHYLSTDVNARYTLRLMGTDYLTIDSLTIKSLGTGSSEYGTALKLTDSANYNVIRNCFIVSDTSSTSSNHTAFTLSGVNSNFGSSISGPSGSNNLIEGNTIIGGYYGLVCNGEYLANVSGNVIRDNKLSDQTYYAIYCTYDNNLVIEGNEVSRLNRSTHSFGFYGMYLSQISGISATGNEVHDPYYTNPGASSTAYGIYMSGVSGTSSNRGLVANNIVHHLNTNGNVYGIYLSTGNYMDIVHNTLVESNPTASPTSSFSYVRMFYLGGTIINTNLQNNLVYFDRGGANIDYIIYSAATLGGANKVDNNAYYTSSSSVVDFSYYVNNAAATFGLWKNATGQDSSSFVIDPFLTDINNNDFTPRSATIDGLGDDFSSVVTTDFTGTTRGNPSDPGAIEFTGAPCTGPVGLSDSAGVTSAVVTFGSNTSGYTIEWGPVGFQQGSAVGTIVNVPAGTTTANLTGMSSNTCYDYYITMPCTSTIPGAPPIVGPITICTDCATPGLTGTYTIGGAAGPNNFATLDSAVDVLNSCGILAPVVFNMSGGTHNPIAIGNVSGASAINTITFNGSLAGDSIISLSTEAAIEFDASAHVTLNNLYASNNIGSYVVWIHDASRDLTLNNCEFVGNPTTTGFSTAVVAANSVNASTTGYSDNVDKLTISGCTIVGNTYGILINGTSSSSRSSGIEILDNHISEVYTYGIRFNYLDSSQMVGNTVAPLRNTYSYGLYANYCDKVDMEENMILGSNQGLTSYYGNQMATSASTSLIANNMVTGGDYGIYLYGNKFMNVYHNTTVADDYAAMYIGGSSTQGTFSSDTVNVRNNIIVGRGSDYALNAQNPPFGFVLDYNLYYNVAGDIANAGGTAYSTLSAWQAADLTKNVNSVTGDPQFVAPGNLHVFGSIANDVGDNSVGIAVDIDGDVRPASGSTVVDMGADEYTPVAHDIAIIDGDFSKNSACLRANDSIRIDVQNVIGVTKDFSTTPLVANWQVTGPINSNGTITVNSGTLAPLATLSLVGTPVDLSIPGVYTLDAYLLPSTENLNSSNDTLFISGVITINSDWEVIPDTVVIISNTTDSVELETRSPLFGGNTFFITEQCHYRGAITGAPTWPSYLLADDYIEITGVPGSDLGGITLEEWTFSTTAPYSTFTFPAGTLIGPNGTAIIAVGTFNSSVPSPSDYYYHANSNSYGSSTNAGRILKDGTGNIIDAVTYGNYTFPPASNVSSSDWSGPNVYGSGTAGIRLEGVDANDSTNWVVSSSSHLMDPNTLNSGVPLPNAPSVTGFGWYLNGAMIDSMPKTVVGPYTYGGVYDYVATYNGPCGVYSDTVTVIVNLPGFCPTPTNISGTAPACDSIMVNWNTATDSSLVAYVTTGGTPGSGTLVVGDSSFAAVGVTPATSYDFYVANICNGDTGMYAGPYTINSGSAGTPVAAINYTYGVLGSLVYDFDALNSTGDRATYTWYFGDGNTGSGNIAQHTYSSGGSYTVSLVVSNACGTDSTSIVIADVSIGENVLSQNLKLYPNPTNGILNLELDLDGSDNISIRIMDMSGKQVFTQSIHHKSESTSESFDISNLSKGIYMIEVSSGEETAIRRLIKE